MDWFTLVLIFIFFILPVIQQVLQQGREKNGEAPMEHEGDPEFDRGPLEPRREQTSQQELPPSRSQPANGGWADDWTPWPGQPEDVTPEPVEEEKAPAVPSRDVWMPPSPEWRTESAPPEPEPSTQPSSQPIEARLDPRVPQPLPAKPRVREKPITLVVQPSRSGAAVSRRALSGSKKLREAIVLKEVLGPPAALRPLERELPW